MPRKKVLLEATPSIKKRVKKLSDKTESSTLKLANITILEWALPHFESGKVSLSPTKPTVASDSE